MSPFVSPRGRVRRVYPDRALHTHRARRSQLELTLVRPAAGHAGRAAASGERERVVDAVAAAEREREAGREAVARAVGVAPRTRQLRRRPLAGAALDARPLTAG